MNTVFMIKSFLVLGYVLVGLISIVLFGYALRRMLCNKRPLLAQIGQSLVMPLVALLLWVGIQKMFMLFLQQYEWPNFPELVDGLQEDLWFLTRIIDVVLVAWLLYRFKMAFQQYALLASENSDWKLDPMKYSLLAKLMTVLSLGTLIIFTLNIFGASLHSLVMFGSAVSLAVGFASQTAVANFVGGLMVYMTGTFQVGEWIIIEDKHVEGTIEEIGWYSTRIKNTDHRPTYVPNSIFVQAVVINMSRMCHRHIKATVGLRYDDIGVVQVIVADIDRMLQDHPGIAQDQRRMVHWTHFGDFSLDIEVYAYTTATKLEDFRAVQQEVFIKVYDIIKRNGGHIATPVHELHMKEPKK